MKTDSPKRWLYALALTLVCVLGSGAAPLHAQMFMRHTFKGLQKSDIETLTPIISAMLSEDSIGSGRPWHSPSGKQGNVRLAAGGAKAGMTTGVVDIDVKSSSGAPRRMTFKYARDQSGTWRTIG
jgi:hypothetical protein